MSGMTPTKSYNQFDKRALEKLCIRNSQEKLSDKICAAHLLDQPVGWCGRSAVSVPTNTSARVGLPYLLVNQAPDKVKPPRILITKSYRHRPQTAWMVLNLRCKTQSDYEIKCDTVWRKNHETSTSEISLSKRIFNPKTEHFMSGNHSKT